MHEWKLDKANRLEVARAYQDVPRVDFSIACAVEGQMGRVFVDDPRQPSAWKLAVGPFVYFAGDPNSPGGQEMLAAAVPYTLMMPSAAGWAEAAREMHNGQIASQERYSFSADRLNLAHLNALIECLPGHEYVRPMDLDFAAQLWNQDHFIDLSDYASPEDFIARGAGFISERSGLLEGAAYASLVCSQGIEVSLYVDAPFRRRGIGTLLAANLLRWALERGLTPNWDAANPESCALALKLGYTPTGSYQALYLRS